MKKTLPRNPKQFVLNERYRITPFVVRLTEDNTGINVPNRIQLFKTGTFKKVMEDGSTVKFSITKDDLLAIIKNFEDNVRGVDIALDFAHKSDEEAAGWFTKLMLEENGNEVQLWGDLDWTPDGHAAVAGKKFRYISPDFAFAWKDNETGKQYGPTLFGAGLTNRPVIKNMAPTVELTEVKMAKKTTEKKEAPKKISELNKEELELRLSEETDEDKKSFIQLRLEELSEDSDDEDEGDGDKKKEKKAKKTPDEMNFDEMKAAYQKQCDEMAEMRKHMAKSLAETQQKENEAAFSLLCAEGKAVPAQKQAFLDGDMVAFVKLSQPVKFETRGALGEMPAETSAQVEILKLADEVQKTRKVSRADALSLVLHENPELNKRYIREMDGLEKP